MGQVVTFADLPATRIAEGVESAPVAADTQEMAVEYVRVAPGTLWTAAAPRGSDCYLFMLAGAATIAVAGAEQRMPTQAFATVQEGEEFVVNNLTNAAADLVKVVAPPRPKERGPAGFAAGLSVIERGTAPMLELPDEHKTRLYFVGKEAAKSERGHAMIVIYDKETVTGMHMHPNAESMFVMLDGAIEFTVNGERRVVRPGQAAIFGMSDRHALHAAEGAERASFLEFHVPAAYETVKG